MTVELKPLREGLDRIDEAILQLLLERQGLVQQVAQLKKAAGTPIRQPSRAAAVFEAREARALALGLDPGFVRSVWETIHEESCRVQALAMREGTPDSSGESRDPVHR